MSMPWWLLALIGLVPPLLVYLVAVMKARTAPDVIFTPAGA